MKHSFISRSALERRALWSSALQQEVEVEEEESINMTMAVVVGSSACCVQYRAYVVHNSQSYYVRCFPRPFNAIAEAQLYSGSSLS